MSYTFEYFYSLDHFEIEIEIEENQSVRNIRDNSIKLQGLNDIIIVEIQYLSKSISLRSDKIRNLTSIISMNYKLLESDNLEILSLISLSLGI